VSKPSFFGRNFKLLKTGTDVNVGIYDVTISFHLNHMNESVTTASDDCDRLYHMRVRTDVVFAKPKKWFLQVTDLDEK